MATLWNVEERKTLELQLSDGVELNLLKEHLPNRSVGAIQRQAQKYNYGVKTINGTKKLYAGRKKRNRRTKVEIQALSEIKTTVGKTRVASTTQEPTTSERTNQNISVVIIADKDTDTAKNELVSISDVLQDLLESDTHPNILSISVEFTNKSIKYLKDQS